MKIAIASDHGGFELKASLKKHLDEEKIEYIDCGTDSTESCDYPDFAEKACRLVQMGEVTYACLICGTGIGMCIAANKMKGIRAALCGDTFPPISPEPTMMPMSLPWAPGSSDRGWLNLFWMNS